ncbi:VWA domain-containing protein [Leucobacter sp. cx-87]|nr:VWA domain-containing protein [Leucobacter sp. cx-87]
MNLGSLRRAAQLTAALALICGLSLAGSVVAASPAAAEAAPVEEMPDTPTTTDPNWVRTPTAEVPPAEEEASAVDAEEIAAAPDAAHSNESAISPLSIPVPTAGSAVITVKVGGDRVANGTVVGLAGVKLGLYGPGTASTAASSGANMPTQGAAGTRYDESWSWTTCISDSAGDCSFVVPIRSGSTPSATGVQQDTRFWVVQETTPTGWYSNPTLRVGGFGTSPETTWSYRFRTDTQLRAETTYASTTAMPWSDTAAQNNPDRYFMRNRIDSNAEGGQSSNVTRTTGVWSESRNNPAPPAQCGVDIAIIADTSGSLGATGIASLKSTMTAFVDALRGTNSRMALLSFSNVSPGLGAYAPGTSTATNFPTLLPVTTAAQAAAYKLQYRDWVSGGGTNWDAGFAATANAAAYYDVAILLTDGNPTVMRGNSNAGSSAFNSLQDVDAGIFSANQLKAKGTRVVALGVGPALTTSSEYNLRAVSGTVAGQDYIRATDFAAASAALKALAEKNCTGAIEVQKMIVPSDGNIANATPAPAGWQFDATSQAATVTIDAPASKTTVVGGNGVVDFGLTFPTATTSGAVQIRETQQPGYSIVPVGAGTAARNAVCVNAATGAALPVTNAGTAAQPGFTVVGQKDYRASCKIYNRAPAPGNLDIKKSANPVSGTEVKPGQNVTYTLTFSNTGGTPIAVAHDDVLTDVLDDATLQGAITAQSPLVAALNTAGNRILITGTLAPGEVKTVTYTVKVNDPISTTSNGVLGNYVVKTSEMPPTTCVPTDPCTVHPIVGSLTWNKVNQTGVRLSGSEWALTPYNAQGQLVPANQVAVVDCVAASAAACTGVDKDPQAGEFLLQSLKLGKYQLVETKAPAGYQLLTSPIDVVVNTNVAYGDIKNLQIEVPSIPLTGGVGSYLFWGSAGGIGALVVAALWYQRRRTQVLSE